MRVDKMSLKACLESRESFRNVNVIRQSLPQSRRGDRKRAVSSFDMSPPTVNMLLLAERRTLADVYGHTELKRYFSAMPCTTSYVNTNSLKSILRATGSQ